VHAIVVTGQSETQIVDAILAVTSTLACPLPTEVTEADLFRRTASFGGTVPARPAPGGPAWLPPSEALPPSAGVLPWLSWVRVVTSHAPLFVLLRPVPPKGSVLCSCLFAHLAANTLAASAHVRLFALQSMINWVTRAQDMPRDTPHLREAVELVLPLAQANWEHPMRAVVDCVRSLFERFVEATNSVLGVPKGAVDHWAPLIRTLLESPEVTRGRFMPLGILLQRCVAVHAHLPACLAGV
jgi:hypothetical protein